jgi:hypothetical protein
MELSSSITARFSTRPCDFCRTNLDAAQSVHRKTGTDHQIDTRGHDLEYRGTEEVLVVESPAAYDAKRPSGDLEGSIREQCLDARRKYDNVHQKIRDRAF